MTGTGEAVVFWVLSCIAVPGALALLFARKAVHAAIGMVTTMIVLGVFYLLQEADFLGVVHIFVYTGAVMMLFLFVVMLVGVDHSSSLVETLRGQRLLTLLASEPRGAVGEALALEVYGETSQSLSTLRAEMARLRSMLGGDIVQSRPYRLAGSVTSDWQMVERHLDGGDLRSAVQAYSGPLLPHSTAPGVSPRRNSTHPRLSAMLPSCGRSAAARSSMRFASGSRSPRSAQE